MSRFSKDAKMMIVIVTLVLFAGYWFLLRPQAGGLAQAKDERAAIEQSVADLQILIDGESGESSGADAALADVDELAAAIPSDGELADLLRQVDVIATTSGMAHSSISPSPNSPNPFGPGGSIQITITATGSHAEAREYLAQLASMPRLVLIEQVGLHVQPDGSEAQLQLAARVFTATVPVGAP